MRMRLVQWLIIILSTYHAATAQEEGSISKKDRVTKGKSFYFLGGPSYRLGSNKGDYSGGLNLEAGYLFRLNRILTIGPSLSFSKFNYDQSISNSFGNPGAKGNNIFQQDDGPGLGYEIYVVHMNGGNLSLFNAGFNIKVDIIPSKEGRRFSAYGIARPFLLLTSRSEMTASVNLWYANTTNPLDDPKNWSGGDPFDYLSKTKPGLEDWASSTQFSAGMNLGLGADYALPSGVSLFLQGTIGTTLPIKYIDTSAFPPYKTTGYYHPDYPLGNHGFTTLNISFGAAYRF
jgi:hypothetical protein